MSSTWRLESLPSKWKHEHKIKESAKVQRYVTSIFDLQIGSGTNNYQYIETMRSFTALVLGAVLGLSSQCNNGGVDAFSPSFSQSGGGSKILKNLEEMRMTGAGGAATPDTNYVDGEYIYDVMCISISA